MQDEKAHEDEEALHQDGGDEPAPFDEEPPVEPGKPQVGNSKAEFFMPTDNEDETEEEVSEESSSSGGSGG